MLRGQVVDIIFGTFFLFFGFAAFAMAALRWRSSVRVLFWMGMWSGLYGVRGLLQTPAVIATLPHWVQAGAPSMQVALGYLLVVSAALAFFELTLGAMRRFLRAVIIAGLAMGLAGMGWLAVTGSAGELVLYDNILAVCGVLVVLTVLFMPGLSRRFLVLADHRMLSIGMLIFAAEILHVTLARPAQYETERAWDSLAFAVLLFAFGYDTLRMILGNEHRLRSAENELTIARQLHSSILPARIPELKGLRVAAGHLPTPAVAGDFYDFLPVDECHTGFLVADVSGDGVPAALIGTMIKVAARSVTPWAHDPAEVLRRLNTILWGQLRGHLVSLSYLWIDTELCRARYSAAGCPPLVCWLFHWRGGELKRIESNGLYLGAVSDCDYPVYDVPFVSGDRFLLCTDGVVEQENAAGISFGEGKLEEILRNNQAFTATELSERLLVEARDWQLAGTTQQDDITLLVIDAL